MVSSFCWSCLTRLRQTPRTILPIPAAPRVATFHSSAVLAKNPLQKKKSTGGDTGPKYRETRSAKIKKKRPTERARPPPVGERKALRKRIVLSNPNALEVGGLQELSAENMVDSRLRGSVLALPVPMISQLRAVEAFKPKQGWSIFRRPGTVTRRETVELGRAFDNISSEDSEEKGAVIKRIVTGSRQSGKSVHLLQATAMAFTKKWVVFAVPEAQDVVRAIYDYAPLSEKEPNVYVQNAATAALLNRTATANKEVLSELKVSQEHPGLAAIEPGMTLEDLAKAGVRDPANAWPIFQALWAELTATSAASGLEADFAPRPPILVTVDSLGYWMQNSAYRSANHELIHAHDLVFVRHFLDLLKPGKGKPTLPNGGALLYATSASNNPSIYALDVALKQAAARHAGVDPSAPEFPVPEAFSYPDSRVLEALNSTKPTAAKEGMLEVQEIGGVTRDEARGFFEYFARSGLLREVINDTWVNEKWTLSGGGLIGELEKVGRRVRVAAA
ncbi:mitochondrial ribosomal death-associated protein 3-domain-containing protein [Aspergillus karnatakaensis]|uniref:mitochondrial 37S ribosomal protein mS29 n=1 Tax=Aspergillus karnatakaensis TaxID=1810916 RepID=UPI003CCD4B96